MIKFSETERIYKRGYQYKRREPDHIFLRCDLDNINLCLGSNWKVLGGFITVNNVIKR